jgi:hypothetical protein
MLTNLISTVLILHNPELLCARNVELQGNYPMDIPPVNQFEEKKSDFYSELI